MQKTKKVLELYRIICHMKIELDRAVGVGELMHVSGYKRSTLFNYLSLLVDQGFIIRVAKGFYVPCDIYQWHFNDIKGGNND